MTPGHVNMTKRKRFLFSALFLALLIAAGELAVFVLLRSRDFYFDSGELMTVVKTGYPNNIIPNDRHLWSYMPDTTFRLERAKENKSVEIRINSQGFRDEEPVEHHDASIKFIALGDSFTFGWLVEKKERYDEILASHFQNLTGRKAASVNLGMWMSAFDQHALILEENFSDCELVVHLVYPGHIQTIARHENTIEDGKIVKITDPTLVIDRHRLLYGAEGTIYEKRLYFPFSLCAINHVRNRFRFKKAIEAKVGKLRHLNHELIFQENGQKHFQHGLDLLKISITQIADFTRKKNIPYLVVVVPCDIQVASSQWRDRNKAPNQEILETALPQEIIEKICDDAQWPLYLDLLPAFRARDKSERLYFKTDPHWSPEGHDFAAGEILNFIMENNVVHAITPHR